MIATGRRDAADTGSGASSAAGRESTNVFVPRSSAAYDALATARGAPRAYNQASSREGPFMDRTKLPATLADIKVAPVPRDPLTGEPFNYRLESGMAVIDVQSLAKLGTPGGVRYEIAIRKRS